jgi:uncharacterized protein HemY
LSKEWAYKAYELIDRLPPDMQWLVNILISAVEKRPLGQVQYLDQYLDLHPQAMIKHYQLGWVKYNLEEWEEAREALQRSWDMRAYYDHKNHTLLKEVDDILDREDG